MADVGKFSRDGNLPKSTYNDDNEIDTLMDGGGGGSGSPNSKFQIIRCCTAPNEPWMKLKVKDCHIILPMPVQLQSQESPSWEGESLGKVGMALDVGQQVMGMLNDAKNSNDGDISAAANEILSEFGQRVSEAGGIGSILKSGLAGDLNGIAKKMGVCILPPKELRFQGISFRNFSFSWKLVPMDKQQSQQIEKMIYKLQYHSLPGGDSGIVAYPDLWDISFGPGDPHHVMYIKTCACTNITVDYSGAGRSVFHTSDLWPIVVNLSLSFTEQTLHTREDVQKGIYG